ncbi:MAG: hypothetical protein JJT78_09305 [Leptospira sp.]|nr:hypothetical protein [Leptospira sp.]
MRKIILTHLIGLFLITIVAMQCTTQKKEPIVPGLTVEKFTENGVEKYRFISIGEATPKAVESKSIAMMQSTSCEAAKKMVRAKIAEIRNNPRANELLAKSEGSKMLEGGKYCESIYTMNVEW